MEPQSSLPYQAYARLGALPAEVVAAEDPPGLLAHLLPDWEVVDAVRIAYSWVCVLRQRSNHAGTEHTGLGEPTAAAGAGAAGAGADGAGRAWALAPLPSSGDFPSDLLAADPSADSQNYWTTVRWSEARVAQRRLMLDWPERPWVVGTDLMGLWQALACTYDRYQYGHETPTGGLEWEEWMAVGWRLSMQHPDGARLRTQDWARMLLGFASEATLERYAWNAAEQTLRSSVFDFSITAVGARTHAENNNWPLRYGHVQAINDTVYDRLREDYFYEALHEDPHTGAARTPETDRTLHDYPTPEEVDRAVNEVLDHTDWRTLDNPQFNRGR